MVIVESLLFVLSLILGTVIVFSIIQFLFSIRPARHYTNVTPEDANLKYEPVSFVTEDNVKIKAWWIPNKRTKATVIVGHGYLFDKGKTLHIAEFLHKKYNLLLYDHRYFGESSGMITTGGCKEVKDVKAAVRYVKHRKGRKAPIALFGFSMSASAMLMSKEKVKAIIADSPYSTLRNAIAEMFTSFDPLQTPFLNVMSIMSKLCLGKSLRQISPQDSVKCLRTPILLIHGNKDTQIGVHNAKELKKANKRIHLWIVPRTDHVQAHFTQKEKYERRVLEFLKNKLK